MKISGFEVTPQQTAGAFRWLFNFGGAGLLGYFVARLRLTDDQVKQLMDLATRPDFWIAAFGAVSSVATLVKGLFSHNKTNIISAAASQPEVKAIVTTQAVANSGALATNEKVMDTPTAQEAIGAS